MQVKKSKQIDGVSFVFSKTEFDLLANTLRKVNLLDTDPNMKKTLQVLENYSYFDLENKQVHTNLGYSELGAAMLALMVPLMIPNDDAEKSIFEELSSRENAKIWKKCDLKTTFINNTIKKYRNIESYMI